MSCFENATPAVKLNSMLEFFVSRHSRKITTTKLVKLVYLADLEAVKKTGRSISGVEYVYYDHGPWSREFHDVLDTSTKICGKRGLNPFGAPAVYYELCDGPPNLRPLDKSEIEILERIDKRWGNMSLRSILDAVYSHEPFISAEFGERIDLTLVVRENSFP